MRIDAHQHFWKYSLQEYPWITEPLSVLKVDRLPADLKPLLDRHNIDGCIAVQARQSLVETDWLLQLANNHGFIKGVVGWVDLRSTEIHHQLRQYSSNKKFVGVRHVVQDEPDAQFMLGKEFQRGIAALADFDLVYDILIYPHQLPSALALVQQFPNQRFVIDHTAKPRIKNSEFDEWSRHMAALGGYENVWCKVSGLVTEADWARWTPKDMEPYLEHVFSEFAEDKLIYGSDWPVSTLAADYARAFDLVDDFLKNHSENARKRFFGQNAVEFYRLDEKS
ncbi:MAG: amidohydrolase [Verrucomicrobiales bacterium]|nr:amidohydrolase [Verrucomicrobiales bacterium]